ncbi:LORF2 protein, partial [Crocuta crocuta]
KGKIKLNNKKRTTLFKTAKYLNRYYTKEDIQMANKHMKRCSSSLVIRELQMETTTRYHRSPFRMANIQKTLTIPITGENCWWECKGVQPQWSTVWQCLTKLNIDLLYNLAITLQGIYPTDGKISVHTKISMQMIIVVLFTIAKAWK